mmetsp:Transcript_20359/g.17659  ORF Transcript_20359/g.17659 Transcript_20359/m.17659 type:complete len:190 (-) Transcript_20359:300-869(-)
MFGAGSAVKEIFGAVYGLLAEPVKGARKKGFKGATKGLGKGVVGLIFKPVAGTIDLFTGTAKGVSRVPGTLYKNIFRIRKKEDKMLKEKRSSDEDHQFELIGEDEENEIFVDRKGALPEEIDLGTPEDGQYRNLYERERRKTAKLSKFFDGVVKNMDNNTKDLHLDHIYNAINVSGEVDNEILEEQKER